MGIFLIVALGSCINAYREMADPVDYYRMGKRAVLLAKWLQQTHTAESIKALQIYCKQRHQSLADGNKLAALAMAFVTGLITWASAKLQFPYFNGELLAPVVGLMTVILILADSSKTTIYNAIEMAHQLDESELEALEKLVTD